jgi:DNA polymerase I-like protein with 3'-5' exonuclease and polymerase domains
MAELPSWAGARRVAVDIETKDPNLKKLGPGVRTDGEIVGVAFAIEDGPAFYLPIAHYAGGNLDRETVLRYLKDQAKVFEGDVVGANLQYDADYLAEVGVKFRGTFRDVQVAEPLLDELQFSYSLDNIATRYGLPGKDESFLRKFAAAWGVNPKSQMWMLPSSAVGSYAIQDVRLPLRLLRIQERKLDRLGLFDLYDVECRLQKVLLKMKRRGVRIDFEKLDQIEKLAIERETAANQRLFDATGVRFELGEINKKAPLLDVMDYLGVKVPRTPPSPKFPKGQESITNEFLATLDHPAADLIRDAKKWNKLRGTFVESIRTHEVRGRIHCTFNQMVGESDSGEGSDGARFGRLSCKNPNMQQQPARDEEIGALWRSIYLPDEGGEWACLDYSQQEPRWLVHYAELCELPKAKEAADAYRNDPNTDNHQMMADLCGIPRKPAKEIFLGRIYGMGGGKLARKLGLPTVFRVHSRTGEQYEAAGPEAQAIIDGFNRGVPFVEALAKMAETTAKREGYIITAGGRHCRFPPKVGGRGYDWTHKALNRLIQGSAGDQTKFAMDLADQAGFKIQLQVHDELDLTIESRKTAEALSEVMLGAMECRVPHRVDIETGPSWGEIS